MISIRNVDRWSLLLAFNAAPLLWEINKFVHPLDEGLLTSTALQVLHGSVMYKDFFEFWPPAAVYMLAGAYAIFGAYFWVNRLLYIVLAYICSLLLFTCCRQAGMPKSTSTINASLFVFVSGALVGYSHHWYGIAGLLLVLLFTQKLIQTQQNKWLYAATLTIGLTFTAMQFEATAAATAVVVSLAAFRTSLRLNAQTIFLAGLTGLAPVMMVFLFFWRLGAAPQLWYDLVAFPLTQYRSVNGTIPGMLVLVQTLVLALTIALSWKIQDVGTKIFLVFAVCLQMLGLTSGNTDRNYLESFLLNSAIIGLIPIALDQLSQKSNIDKIHQMVGVYGTPGVFIKRLGTISLICGYLLAILIASSLRWLTSVEATQPVQTKAGTVYADPVTANKLRRVINFTNRHSRTSKDVYFGPYASYYYLLTQHLDPSGFSQLTPNYNPPWMFQKAVYNLQKNNPQIIVLLPRESPFKFDQSNILSQYVGHSYRRVEDLPAISLYSSNIIFADRIQELHHNQPADGIYVRQSTIIGEKH